MYLFESKGGMVGRKGMRATTLRLFRRLHRWCGLLLAGLICFYCLTGLLLNHRRDFGYYLEKIETVSDVPRSDTSLMRSFIETYKRQIGRQDDPAVIRIRGGQAIEFLYGSHGKTTYVIYPDTGKMKRVVKRARQPWVRLNNLHKVVKTSTAWLIVADCTCLAILFLTLSGLLILPYRLLDWLLFLAGLLIPIVAVFL